MNNKEKLVLRAALLITPLIFLSFFHFEIQIFQQIFFSQITYLLNLFNIRFQTQGYQIITSNFSSIITFDCTGWKQFYIFCALIFLPLEIKLSSRLKGLLFLIPLYFYNLFRVIISIYVGSISYLWFKPLHYFLWNFLFLALVFVFWFWWYQRNMKKS
jgi:exosortase/archaeosortase family protein